MRDARRNIALSLSWGSAMPKCASTTQLARIEEEATWWTAIAARCTSWTTRPLVQTLTVPPMAEGIDDVNGEVYLANEAASNLYLLGKFYGGQYVYSFPTRE